MNEPIPEHPRPQTTGKTDWSGVIIGLACVPVMLFFHHRGEDDLGLAAFIALGSILVAIKVKWALRKHVWFWATTLLVLGLNVALVLLIRLPKGPKPVAVLLPFGIADFFIALGAMNAMERLMTRGKG